MAGARPLDDDIRRPSRERGPRDETSQELLYFEVAVIAPDEDELVIVELPGERVGSSSGRWIGALARRGHRRLGRLGATRTGRYQNEKSDLKNYNLPNTLRHPITTLL